MHRLLQYMTSNSMLEIVDKNPDLYFATVWLDDAPKNVPIVYRAASCYYDTKQSKRHSLNKRIAKNISKSNYVIFQSYFGKKLCEEVLGVRARKSCVIKNGFDESPFIDIEPYKTDKKHLYVACSDWKNPAKRGHAIAKAFHMAKVDSSELIMIGPGSESWQGKYRNINCVGKKSINDIASYMKSADVFIHMGFAEVCPNVVSEALRFGCFVLCNNVGGTSELVNNNGKIINCDSKFRFKRHDATIDLNIDMLSSSIQDCSKVHFKTTSDDLSMSCCASKYLEVFESVVKK